MANKKLYVDFHVLQTVPPSCVNRDDTGSPKTAVYGGKSRARVSSQAWKRAMREMFRDELLAEEDVGKRTKRVKELIVKEIEAQNDTVDASQLVDEAFKDEMFEKVGLSKDVLFFISDAQVKKVAELITEQGKNKKEHGKALKEALKEVLKEALKENPTIDMALFGRMVASEPGLNYDAAAQVAHSISTHAVQNEFDFFTAVDDCAPEDSSGAGHIGTTEYNSATLYRYANINVCELAESLENVSTAKAVRVFAEAFVRSMPTGKQNTFANRTMPDAVYITLREDQPVNLCGAFERAIPVSANGYVEPSKKRLVEHAQCVCRDYIGAPLRSFTIGTGLEQLETPTPMRTTLDLLESAVAEWLAERE